MKTIFAFGDSITYGSWDLLENGWTSLLRNHLDKNASKPAYYLYSLGIPGETSDGLRKRIMQEIVARKRSDDETYTVIIACGANDATWLTNENCFKVSAGNYVNNMEKIFEDALELTNDVYALNITPVNEAYSLQFKGNVKSCLNKYVDEYNMHLKQSSFSHNIPLIDINQVFSKVDSLALLTQDGLHPNNPGHRLIFDCVKKILN